MTTKKVEPTEKRSDVIQNEEAGRRRIISAYTSLHKRPLHEGLYLLTRGKMHGRHILLEGVYMGSLLIRAKSSNPQEPYIHKHRLTMLLCSKLDQ